ncbi:hypothetical protein I4U23_008650 [Adineta vaga]|nr:hypothetical protein I4U23_008650 [Adineta vaga]
MASSSNTPWDILIEFIDSLWIPNDSTNFIDNLDEEAIQQIYAELLTVENPTNYSCESFDSLFHDESNSMESTRNPFDISDGCQSSSSRSMTPLSSDDADDEPTFNFQDWYIYDRATCKTRPPKLFEFLHLLLNNTRYSSHASWLNKNDGLFRIHKPNEVASLWRKVKVRRTNGSMNYDTFARGIRYYYKSGLMLKTHTKHTYCFAQISDF